jgi:hypothetical protein
VNIKSFFVDALGSALELGLATADDVLRHVPPDVLAEVLPRPLWARLLTACLGAPRVDPQLVVETIGVPNLCEHVPSRLIWACLADLAARSLGQEVASPAVAPGPSASTSASAPLVSPPPDAAPAPAAATPPASAPQGPSIPAPGGQPLEDLINEHDDEERPEAPARARTTSQRFRPSSTGVGRLGNRDVRRPQAQAAPPAPSASGRSSRRVPTEVSEVATETAVEPWQDSLAVEDSQLVDWQSAEETQLGDEFRRKR